MTSQPLSSDARPSDQGDSAELARVSMVARRFCPSFPIKKETGSQLGISRFKVARLLELARQRGLIYIAIDSPGGFGLDLVSELQDRFDPTVVWVVEEASSNLGDDKKRLGIAAAFIVAS